MKKIYFITIQITLMFLTCNAQKSNKNNLGEIKKEIEASNIKQFEAFAKRDSSLYISRYTSDCWIMAPNAPAFSGVDAASDFFRIAYEKIGIRSGKFITIAIFGSGEFVTETGFWETFDANNKSIANGKYIVIWKKTSEGWKRFRDCFNSDRGK